MGRYVSGLGSDEKKLAMAQAKADAVSRRDAGLPPLTGEPPSDVKDNTALYIGGAVVLAAILLLKDKK